MIRSELKLEDGRTTYVFDPSDHFVAPSGKEYKFASIKKFQRQKDGRVKVQIVTLGEDGTVLQWLNQCLSVGQA